MKDSSLRRYRGGYGERGCFFKRCLKHIFRLEKRESYNTNTQIGIAIKENEEDKLGNKKETKQERDVTTA